MVQDTKLFQFDCNITQDFQNLFQALFSKRRVQNVSAEYSLPALDNGVGGADVLFLVTFDLAPGLPPLADTGVRKGLLAAPL